MDAVGGRRLRDAPVARENGTATGKAVAESFFLFWGVISCYNLAY